MIIMPIKKNYKCTRNNNSNPTICHQQSTIYMVILLYKLTKVNYINKNNRMVGDLAN